MSAVGKQLLHRRRSLRHVHDDVRRSILILHFGGLNRDRDREALNVHRHSPCSGLSGTSLRPAPRSVSRGCPLPFFVAAGCSAAFLCARGTTASGAPAPRHIPDRDGGEWPQGALQSPGLRGRNCPSRGRAEGQGVPPGGFLRPRRMQGAVTGACPRGRERRYSKWPRAPHAPRRPMAFASGNFGIRLRNRSSARSELGGPVALALRLQLRSYVLLAICRGDFGSVVDRIDLDAGAALRFRHKRGRDALRCASWPPAAG